MPSCALTAANVHKASTAAVSLFLFFICIPSHLFLSERTVVFSTMAGLLTFPRSALPSQPCARPVTFSKQTLCFEGITAAGTVPDFHRIPLHRGGPKPPDYHQFCRKGTTFSSITNQSAKIFQNKKEKGTETHQKISEFQHLNWKRDPVGAFEWYFKSRYDALKDCGFVIYEWPPSRNNRLKPLLYHKKGGHCIPQTPIVYQAGEQRLERDHRPSQRAIGRALRHRGHRDWRQGHKNFCKPNANEFARFAEAPPSLSNQAQDEYQRLMNNKIVIK